MARGDIFDDVIGLYEPQCLFTLHLMYQEHFTLVFLYKDVVLHQVVLILLLFFMCIFLVKECCDCSDFLIPIIGIYSKV